MIEPVVTERMGAVPVAAEFLRRLNVVGIVDALCPLDPRAELTYDQMIKVLVATGSWPAGPWPPATKARAGRPAAAAGYSPGDPQAVTPEDDHRGVVARAAAGAR
ncbi:MULTISPECIES: hypothetical protein [unclassified Streptomyces]|uniref:hypothetical protein n=1 Tax=unclassified Streptomyces TaxID=2593676 RepID=UPI003804A147